MAPGDTSRLSVIGMTMNRKKEIENQLTESFHQRMETLADDTDREIGRRSTRFRQDLADLGGVDTAKKYLRAEPPASGFVDLMARDFCHLTVEWVVANESEWAELFTDEDRRKARSRLPESG